MMCCCGGRFVDERFGPWNRSRGRVRDLPCVNEPSCFIIHQAKVLNKAITPTIPRQLMYVMF